MENRKLLLFTFVLMFASNCMAQIGYQVSLLNNATDEPRANESVNVVVRISDSNGGIICEQTKQETTNDFGVLSMAVGDSGTFQNVDWSKLPFFIEASVDGRLIGKSQILSVPVAEYAKQTGVLTKELLCSKTWKCEGSYNYDRSFSLTFADNASYKIKVEDKDGGYVLNGKYEINGDFIILTDSDNEGSLMKYCIDSKRILWESRIFH